MRKVLQVLTTCLFTPGPVSIRQSEPRTCQSRHGDVDYFGLFGPDMVGPSPSLMAPTRVAIPYILPSWYCQLQDRRGRPIIEHNSKDDQAVVIKGIPLDVDVPEVSYTDIPGLFRLLVLD